MDGKLAGQVVDAEYGGREFIYLHSNEKLKCLPSSGDIYKPHNDNGYKLNGIEVVLEKLPQLICLRVGFVLIYTF